MTAKQRYAQAMEWLYIACIAVSGIALVAITLMIPTGVFMRYVLNDPLSWPEPASVVLMVMFSFIGGAAAFRAHVHVAVMALKNAVGPALRRGMDMAVNACVAATALFMLYYGIHLCVVVRNSTVAEFPDLSVAIVYAPIPIAGLFTLLFLIERVWVGDPPKTSIMYADQSAEVN